MIKNFIKELGCEIYEEASLKKYNTYKIDIKCKYLILPNNKEELINLLKLLKKHSIKYLVLGNGSNIIFSCNYYAGAVILLNKLKNITINNNQVEVEAGYYLPKLSIELSKLGLQGLEFAAGIPGNVGASIAMNAGAYKSSMSEVVEDVTLIDENYNIITLNNKDLEFSYRSSIFKKNKNYIIISAKIKLDYGNKDEILEKINKRKIKRLETQPLDMPSAGSVFRNPEGMHAGELIEKCNLKGCSIGDAIISEKHANFIVNKGNATGKDIISLIEKIKKEVKQQFNVDLILEQIIID